MLKGVEMQGRNAFTVSELLFALVIVAILLALVLTSARSFRRLSDDARCVNHLRTLGQGTLLYFGERNGDFFPSWDWHKNRSFLETVGIPAPHSGNGSQRDSLLTCPAFKKAHRDLFPTGLNRSYSLNYFAHYYRPQDQQSADVPDDPAYWQRLFPGNLRQIASPSGMWMFMDGAQNGYVFTYCNRGHLPYVSYPHNGRNNAVFFDGHVQPVEPKALKQPLSSNFWGGPDA